MNRMTAIASEQEQPQEDWQAKVERLQELVCSLLLRNQMLRLALQDEMAGAQGAGNSEDFFASSSIGRGMQLRSQAVIEI
jgi:hypothetical protein